MASELRPWQRPARHGRAYRRCRRANRHGAIPMVVEEASPIGSPRDRQPCQQMDGMMTEIALKGDHITLGQLLKLLGAAGTGGDVKRFLEGTEIVVNNAAENRRGRKLRKGDVVKWNS